MTTTARSVARRSRSDDNLGIQSTQRNYAFHLRDRAVGRHRNDGLNVSGSLVVSQITPAIAAIRLDQREIGHGGAGRNDANRFGVEMSTRFLGLAEPRSAWQVTYPRILISGIVVYDRQIRGAMSYSSLDPLIVHTGTALCEPAVIKLSP
jgi:hypothetical protein